MDIVDGALNSCLMDCREGEDLAMAMTLVAPFLKVLVADEEIMEDLERATWNEREVQLETLHNFLSAMSMWSTCTATD